MTQPGVSQHIRKLEAQLGAALIDRDGKGFALTDAGAELREIGLRRRAEEEALRLSIAFDDPGHGDLRIGAPGGFTLGLWTRLARIWQNTQACVCLWKRCRSPALNNS